MAVHSREVDARGGLDVTRLLDAVNHPPGPERTINILKAFASSGKVAELAQELKREDAVKVVNAFDQVIGLDLRKSQNTTLLRALGSLCSATIQLPHGSILSDGLERRGGIAVASGGFTDVWRGRLKTKNVALKAFRTYPIQDLKEAQKILWKQVVLWKRLRHENVLPFHGVDTKIFQLALVYDWAEFGNIMQYLESNPKASRAQLLREVTEGIKYLHSHGIIHGDLKGANVLISQNGNACLSDYGLTAIQSNHAFMIAATPGVVGMTRWLAPELINPPRGKGHQQPAGTEQADIFAFAMLVIEVFTGELPFGGVRHEAAILMIVRGQRPEKTHDAESRGLTAKVWKFNLRCWNQSPTKRPNIGAVVTAWQDFDSQERLRRSVPVADLSYQEKRQSQSEKSFGESTDEPKKMRFCGLF